jgi:hypothetical protein
VFPTRYTHFTIRDCDEGFLLFAPVVNGGNTPTRLTYWLQTPVFTFRKIWNQTTLIVWVAFPSINFSSCQFLHFRRRHSPTSVRQNRHSSPSSVSGGGVTGAGGDAPLSVGRSVLLCGAPVSLDGLSHTGT